MSAARVSLVVPVRNESASIERLLASIDAQTRPPDEVVLVDGASDDGTDRLIAAWRPREGTVVRHLRLERAVYPGGARNRGARAATHPLIAFTDAGIALEPVWLEALLAATDAGAIEAVFGDIEPDVPDAFSRVAAIAYVSPRARTDAGPCRPPSVASMLMSRALFERIGGFPEDLRASEDLVFMRALYALGVPYARAPRARARWSMAHGFAATFRRFRTYSRHGVAAGLIDDWQAPVLRRYAAIGATGVATGLVLGPVAGAGATLAGVSALLALRAARACWTHRDEVPGDAAAWLLRFPGVMAVLATIDAAAFLGVVDWWLAERVSDGARATRGATC